MCHRHPLTPGASVPLVLGTEEEVELARVGLLGRPWGPWRGAGRWKAVCLRCGVLWLTGARWCPHLSLGPALPWEPPFCSALQPGPQTAQPRLRVGLSPGPARALWGGACGPPMVGCSLTLFSHHFDPIRLLFSRTFLPVSCQLMLFSHCLPLLYILLCFCL